MRKEIDVVHPLPQTPPSEEEIFTLPIRPPRQIRKGVELTGIITLKACFEKGKVLEPGEEVHLVDPCNKTKWMREVEEQIGEPLEIFIVREHWINNRSVRNIREELGFSEVLNWARRLSVPIRTQKEAGSLAWKDQDSKARRIQLIHSAEADAKRAESMKKMHAQNPDFKRSFVEAGHEAMRKRRVENMQGRLGEKPEEVLQNLIAQGLSDREIGQRVGVSDDTIRFWRKLFGIERIERTKPRAQIDASKAELVKAAFESGQVEHLTDRQRIVLELRYSRRLTVREAAIILGVTFQAVLAVEKRALARLQKPRAQEKKAEKPKKEKKQKEPEQFPSSWGRILRWRGIKTVEQLVVLLDNGWDPQSIPYLGYKKAAAIKDFIEEYKNSGQYTKS